MKKHVYFFILTLMTMLSSFGVVTAQETVINGSVSDSSTPLPGVNVVEKGTTNGVTSDFDGNYSITVKEGAVLVFSYVGFETQEVSTRGDASYDIVMAPSAEALEEVLKYGRYTTLFLMILAAVWAPMIQNFGGIWSYLQQMFSIIVPPIAVIFLVGVFYKKGNKDGAYWTLIIGTLMGLFLFILGQFGLWSLHYTYNVGIMSVFSALVFVVISNLTSPPKDEVIKNFTYNKGLITQDTEGLTWYKNYTFQIAVLLAVIGLILVLFW